MLLGVVSDTHNNLRNIEQIISLFNNEEITSVIHTGDITNSKSLEKFSALDADLIGVYGNNDRNEVGLEDIAIQNNFLFQEPPSLITLCDKNIAIFHEPDMISSFLSENKDIDIVIHGHTHRPAIHNLNIQNTDHQRIVLGDWYDQGSCLEWDESGPNLIKLYRR